MFFKVHNGSIANFTLQTNQTPLPELKCMNHDHLENQSLRYLFSNENEKKVSSFQTKGFNHVILTSYVLIISVRVYKGQVK